MFDSLDSLHEECDNNQTVFAKRKQQTYSPWSYQTLDPLRKSQARWQSQSKESRPHARLIYRQKEIRRKPRSLQVKKAEYLSKVQTISYEQQSKPFQAVQVNKIKFPQIAKKTQKIPRVSRSLTLQRQQNLNILYNNNQSSLRRRGDGKEGRKKDSYNHFQVYKRSIVAAHKYVLNCLKPHNDIDFLYHL